MANPLQAFPQSDLRAGVVKHKVEAMSVIALLLLFAAALAFCLIYWVWCSRDYMSTKQKFLLGTVIGLFGLLTCFALGKWALYRFRDSEDRQWVHNIAHSQGWLLKNYVGRTKRFPESLPAMVAEEELPPEWVLGAPPGGTTIYTQPSSAAAGTTAVYVVTSLRHQAVVTKDFRIVISKTPRP